MKAYDVCSFVDIKYSLPFWVEKKDDCFVIDLNPSTLPDEIYHDCQVEIQEILSHQFTFPKSINILQDKTEAYCVDNYDNENKTILLQHKGLTDETVIKLLFKHVRELLLNKLILQEFNQFMSEL